MNPCRYLFRLVLLWLIVGGSAYAQNPDFDHLSTGFALDGAHSSVSCEGCHANANFTATRSSCESCHSNGGTVRASAKPDTFRLRYMRSRIAMWIRGDSLCWMTRPPSSRAR